MPTARWGLVGGLLGIIFAFLSAWGIVVGQNSIPQDQTNDTVVSYNS